MQLTAIGALAVNAAATLTVAAGVWLSPDIHGDVPLSGVFAVGLMGCGFALCLAGPAPLRFIRPLHYYTQGDALAQGHVLRPQLVVLVGVGVVGFILGHAFLMRRDLAP